MNEQKIIEALKEISDLRNVKVGDKVWTVQDGWDEIVDINLGEEYTIGTNINRYALDGIYVKGEYLPCCFTQNPFTYILEKFSNQERIVEVDLGGTWFKRRLIKLMPNGYACVYGAIGVNHFCDSIEKTNDIGMYSIWREVPTIPTFTKEQICKALNVDDFEIKE